MAAESGWNREAKIGLYSTFLFQKIYKLEHLRCLPSTEQRDLEKIFQHKVFKMLRKITEGLLKNRNG